jgi:hypothetical protein
MSCDISDTIAHPHTAACLHAAVVKHPSDMPNLRLPAGVKSHLNAHNQGHSVNDATQAHCAGNSMMAPRPMMKNLREQLRDDIIQVNAHKKHARLITINQLFLFPPSLDLMSIKHNRQWMSAIKRCTDIGGQRRDEGCVQAVAI